MSFIVLLKAEYMLVYSEIMRRKSALMAIIIYPYLFAGLTLFVGFFAGSPQSFVERVGIDPIVFMVTASYMIMAITTGVDDILWRPLSDLWIGTLIYIIASPVNKLKLFMAMPIPRLTLLLMMGFTSILPVYVAFYGLYGISLTIVVIALSAIGALVMTPLGIAISGLMHIVSDSWRILNIVRPLLFVFLGAYYPRMFMPLVLRLISYSIPSSYTVELVQRLLIGIASTDVIILLGLSIALATIYVPLGRRSIRYWEKKKVKEGVKAH
ncbi:MAG: ABC transporter permease [Ignisphaera sp.]